MIAAAPRLAEPSLAHPASAERRCLVTREVRPREALVRFALDAEGWVRADVDERLPGRGMWLSAERDVVNRACAGKVFARAARAPVKVDADLADQVERLLARRVRDGFGLARRAGQVAIGFEQVRALLRTGSVAVLVAASDGAADGRAKLRRLAAGLPLITVLSRAELGAALGRESVVHAAVAPGGLAQRLMRDTARLAGFRPGALPLPETTVAPRRIDARGTTELR